MWIQDILSKNNPSSHKATKGQGKILALSPMADMTDSPFCRIVRRIGGADIVFREMVSSEALVRDNEKTLKMAEYHPEESPIVQQIFGADPLTMARAAEIVMKHSNPAGIDINMGCPVYKITSNFNGCALMKDPELAGNIVKEMKRAIGDTPLSVKIRLGWSDPDDFKNFIPAIEQAGAELITIHGRTKEQGYSGVSDWNRIAEAKAIATVPLLANGDIHEPTQVDEALKVTGADGALIARGALGNPWFFSLVENDREISLEERKKVVMEHAKLHVEQYGEKGVVTFRKHLSWYFKTNKIGFYINGLKEWRSKIVRVKTLTELEELLEGLG